MSRSTRRPLSGRIGAVKLTGLGQAETLDNPAPESLEACFRNMSVLKAQVVIRDFSQSIRENTIGNHRHLVTGSRSIRSPTSAARKTAALLLPLRAMISRRRTSSICEIGADARVRVVRHQTKCVIPSLARTLPPREAVPFSG